MTLKHAIKSIKQIIISKNRGKVNFVMIRDHPFCIDLMNLIIPFNPLKIYNVELNWIEIKWYYILREKSEIINLGNANIPYLNNISYYSFDQEIFTKYILIECKLNQPARYPTISNLKFFQLLFFDTSIYMMYISGLLIIEDLEQKSKQDSGDEKLKINAYHYRFYDYYWESIRLNSDTVHSSQYPFTL